MPFCNVKDDLEKIRAFIKENGYDNPEQLNEHLKACVYMEAASFIGFWNTLMGYYLAKSLKDAMCKMCKDDSLSVKLADTQEHLNRVRMEPYIGREKITKQEKAEICFWLQYMNNLGGCPTGSVPSKSAEKNNTYAHLMPGFPCWPRT